MRAERISASPSICEIRSQLHWISENATCTSVRGSLTRVCAAPVAGRTSFPSSFHSTRFRCFRTSFSLPSRTVTSYSCQTLLLGSHT